MPDRLREQAPPVSSAPTNLSGNCREQAPPQPNRPSPSLNRPLPPPEERRGRLQQRSQTISLQLEESCYSLHRRRGGVPLPPANLLHPLRFLQRAKWVLKMKR
ncbi:hypothetical protein PAHAL_2G216300 [Panicum hallii]|uniref:Uncharacterized protein n=1 Tax=Panicum hallii TaxID=206008 RepID=A0A2T8KPX9_9POAL|nr:hypothetical protein PAHAL_2G216300 [Panicum hallii]